MRGPAAAACLHLSRCITPGAITHEGTSSQKAPRLRGRVGGGGCGGIRNAHLNSFRGSCSIVATALVLRASPSLSTSVQPQARQISTKEISREDSPSDSSDTKSIRNEPKPFCEFSPSQTLKTTLGNPPWAWKAKTGSHRHEAPEVNDLARERQKLQPVRGDQQLHHQVHL